MQLVNYSSHSNVKTTGNALLAYFTNTEVNIDDTLIVQRVNHPGKIICYVFIQLIMANEI